MALVNRITKSGEYQEYLQTIKQSSSQRLDNCFACGLPAAWSYMVLLGLEPEFFNLIHSVKDNSYKFKDLFYLLQLTNEHSNFFPQIPSDLLKIEIAKEVLAAQLEIAKPDFELAFALNAEQLTEVLQELATPNRMIQIGSKQLSVGVIFKDNKYRVYMSNNEQAESYESLKDCVDSILSHFVEKDSMRQVIFVQGCGLQNIRLQPAPDALELFKKFCKSATPEELQAVLYTSVQAGLFDQVLHLQELGVDFTRLYRGIDLLTLAVSQPKVNLSVIELLLTKIDPARAIEHLHDVNIARDPNLTQKVLATLGDRVVVKPLVHSHTTHEPSYPQKQTRKSPE